MANPEGPKYLGLHEIPNDDSGAPPRFEKLYEIPNWEVLESSSRTKKVMIVGHDPFRRISGMTDEGNFKYQELGPGEFYLVSKWVGHDPHSRSIGRVLLNSDSAKGNLTRDQVLEMMSK